MLPIKDESIMISDYPKYEKKYVFDKDTMDRAIIDIQNIRNLKATNGITKDALVKINYINEEVSDLLKHQLKITDDKLVDNSNLASSSYESKNISITYYYESLKNNDNSDEINKLKESIARREKLLSNENYVNKAPANIVAMDRQKLEEEKARLELLMK